MDHTKDLNSECRNFSGKYSLEFLLFHGTRIQEFTSCKPWGNGIRLDHLGRTVCLNKPIMRRIPDEIAIMIRGTILSTMIFSRSTRVEAAIEAMCHACEGQPGT